MLSATKVYFRISSRFAVLFCFMFVKRERERERENFEERKVMTATRKSNQIKNLLLLLSREKEKNRKGRRRDPHLFSFFNRCGWVWRGGEEGISFRFERALLLLENSVIFDDVSKAMTSPLSFALSPPQKKNKKNVWVFSFGKK